MLRNYFFINLLLAIIIGLLGFKLYKVSTYAVDRPSEPRVKEVQKRSKEPKSEEIRLTEKMFQVISEKDLFRPSRSAPVGSDGKTQKATSKDPPKLFGTIILKDNKTAILEDPDTKKTKTYRIDDSIAGYVLSDILEDKVVLLNDGEKLEVRLREDKGIKPPKRAVRQPPEQRKRPVRKPRTRRTPRSRSSPDVERRRVNPPRRPSPNKIDNGLEQLN